MKQQVFSNLDYKQCFPQKLMVNLMFLDSISDEDFKKGCQFPKKTVLHLDLILSAPF